MFFNEKQLLALNATKMSKIIFKKMFKKDHQLGYTDKGDQYGYHINIASDAPNEDIKNITLLHEAGHIYLHHIDENIKEELNTIGALLKSSKKTFKDLKKYYGGPLNFLNICMDLEVNSKILTKANIDLMEEFFPLCTPEKYNVPVFDKFFEYYEPLIKRINDIQAEDEKDDKEEEEEQNKNNSNLNSENSSKQDNSSSEASSEDNKENNNENPLNNNENNKSRKKDDNLENQKENNEKQTEDSLEKDKGGLNDIPNFDIDYSDLSNDLQDALEDENYSLYNDNNETDLEVSAVKYLFSIGIGTDHNDSKEEDIEIVENNNKNIEKFLRNILGDNMIIRQDAMRHYNRGTRDRSNGILYNSLRRRVEFDRKRLGIIIDVSGSMNTSSLTMALSSLQDCYQLLDQESEIFTWDTNLIQNFKINKIPKKIISGGGTELSSALRYVSRKKFTDIIIYSDFETYPVEDFNEAINNVKATLHPILVLNSWHDDQTNKKTYENIKKYFPNLFQKNNYLLVK